MQSTSCKLAALGMATTLGSSCQAIFDNILSSKQIGFELSAEFSPENPVWLARVRMHLDTIPPEFAAYDCPVNQFLQIAYKQIEDKVVEAIQRFGAGRIGVVLGSSTAGIVVGENAIKELTQHGKFPPNYRYSQQEPAAMSDFLALYAGLKGPSYTVCTACSSTAKAFVSARNLLRCGICDAVIVGGADSLCQMTIQGFSSLDLISPEICNPLTKNRSGITLGEGAALFLMTAEPGGIQLTGIGESSDAYHISAPEPTGVGAELSMLRALDDAMLTPEDVHYINMHGTGTLQNDSMESAAIARVFPSDIYCSSTKPLTGHTLGVCAAIELGFCWLTLEQSQNSTILLPPHCVSGEIDNTLPPLKLVKPGCSIQAEGQINMLSNSFAFGGSNCSLIISRNFAAGSR